MKPIEEMNDAEICKVIKDEIPFICYRDIYRPVISERLKQNESYCRVKQLYTEKPKRHSQKPEISYEIIERLYPELPKIELYARNFRAGWDCWGNEVNPDAEHTP